MSEIGDADPLCGILIGLCSISPWRYPLNVPLRVLCRTLTS